MTTNIRGEGRPWRIAVVSGMVLVLELALIRQVPAEVRIISYFTNLLLIASFFGLGIGCILSRVKGLGWLTPVGLLLVACFVLVGRGVVTYEESKEVMFWLNNDLKGAEAVKLPILPAAVAAFVFAAMPFIGLGQALVRAMAPHPRLLAYGWDILGSLAGTMLFSVTAYFGGPPWIWPIVIAVLWAWLYADRWWKRVLVVSSGAAFLLFSVSPLELIWSPYYYVQYQNKPNSLMVFVNSGLHQVAVNFNETSGEKGFDPAKLMEKFSTPYRTYSQLNDGKKPGRILVLGAGTGNDVAVALKNGATEIVAVEIDPEILKLGKTLNKSNPYGDTRVQSVVDDARHYLRTTDKRFDLIIFGTLDSQTLLSGISNLRLDNYVYTAEAFQDAKNLLEDDGLAAAYYSIFAPWLLSRLYSTMNVAFGDQMYLQVFEDRHLFNAMIMGGKNQPLLKMPPEAARVFSQAIPATDDWPFVFLETKSIAPIYLNLLGVLLCLIVGVFLVLRKVERGEGFRVNFLFLGIGFTLVESAALVRLALVFGTTWIVNSVVFSSVLAAIYLTNLAVMKGRAPSLKIAWVGLFASILLNFLIPVQWLFPLPFAARVLASGLLIGLPVMFSAICFSRLFAAQKEPGYALGINLIGAMAGGLFEWSSMVVGMRSVWLLALVIYLLACLFTYRKSETEVVGPT